MSGVTAIDHALPNGNGNDNNAAMADPGGMTNDEKDAVGGMLRTDEARGAAVHVSWRSHTLSILDSGASRWTSDSSQKRRDKSRTNHLLRFFLQLQIATSPLCPAIFISLKSAPSTHLHPE